MKSKKNQIYKEASTDPSIVPPWLAAVLSAIIPGLGQALARAVQRGIVLFFSFISIVGLLIWRFKDAAPRDEGIVDIVLKAFRLEPIFILISILFVIFYIWIIIDAYQMAKIAGKPDKRKPIVVIVLLILVFFAIGWQIGQIDPYAFVTKFGDALPAISRVLWPWERAITYPQEEWMGTATLETPCDDTPPPQTEPLEDKPYLIVDPTCGIPSEQEEQEDGSIKVLPGTKIHVQGYNFTPDKEVEIWWQDPAISQFRHREDGNILRVIPDQDGYFEEEITWPYRLIPDSYLEGGANWELQGRQVTTIGDWEFSNELKMAIEKMIETIFIGMMATFFGIILALPFSFLAARNLMRANVFTLGIYYLVRGVLNIIRSIEPLIWAIIAIIIVGLGPFAGILALVVHSIAALGKLYSEAIESIDPGPIEAVTATGANWFQIIMYGVIPQIIPPFVSFTIYRWDINIRMSTVIGLVGGGGIGYLLTQWIRMLDYSAAGIAVWFIAITVAILDYISAEIREKFV
ncbi:MAG: phosphonate ABC transporter, permease protein PhnE [Chloroflexota bacterium]|nr:phosphonate ABC transporter, permease protein PhnE [Chloroflexota bacterium]